MTSLSGGDILSIGAIAPRLGAELVSKSKHSCTYATECSCLTCFLSWSRPILLFLSPGSTLILRPCSFPCPPKGILPYFCTFHVCIFGPLVYLQVLPISSVKWLLVRKTTTMMTSILGEQRTWTNGAGSFHHCYMPKTALKELPSLRFDFLCCQCGLVAAAAICSTSVLNVNVVVCAICKLLLLPSGRNMAVEKSYYLSYGHSKVTSINECHSRLMMEVLLQDDSRWAGVAWAPQSPSIDE